MRVLALVPGGISDQLQFFPTLTTLKKNYPNAEIAIVVEPAAKSAYRVSRAVSELIPFDYQGQNSPSDWANLLGIIRDREFELALCASHRWEEGVLLWLSGIPTRIGYSSTQVPWLYTSTVATDMQQSSTSPALLQSLAISPTAPPIEFNVPEEDIAWADAQCQSLGVADSGYVVMYPGLNAQADSYPLDSWMSLIDDFQAKQPQLPVIILETVDSKDTTTSLGRQRNLKTVTAANLGQIAALLAGANLVISPDSYVSQVAMTLQVFTLVLQTTLSQPLPPTDGEMRALGVQSATENLADLPPGNVLQKVWGT
ncbi:glycosyltransferase family 9 protein [Leptolyngbya cf. ectocarpi LEGE 11479]|uniref:Glycosyltransferase family 9 protein n=1 Tax=Leptolyngbya cf. ectocarpi LEGE 11479 TaxID=1828722 RepID=A0A928X0Z4_LEPEC|nr:glycosyltransferase family 9 protein [Leptolyngbya ectocarpi]MBE9065539.1 glycosyltransferase family 9 protein [Leptolyngbya cf. ectocarpi LEGE 11479]